MGNNPSEQDNQDYWQQYQDFEQHYDDWVDCPNCEEGYIDECECTRIVDQCNCAEPTPRMCFHCKGAGGWKREE